MSEEKNESLEKMNEELEAQRKRMVERLRSARYDSRVTLAEIKEKTGLAVSTIIRLEKGEIRTCKIENIQKLAEIYGVNAGWLFGLDMPREDETDEHEKLRKSIADDLIFVPMDDLKKLKHFMDDFIRVEREDI